MPHLGIPFALFVLYFSQFVFLGWRVCRALVPRTLARELPTLIHSLFLVLLCLTVTTEFVSGISLG